MAQARCYQVPLSESPYYCISCYIQRAYLCVEYTSPKKTC